MTSLFAGHKRDLGGDVIDDGGSANFKKLKSDLGMLFGFGNNTLLQQHNTMVSFRELAILDDKACTNLVDILKTHGYYKVKEMPPEFVNACGNLYSSCKCYFGHDEHFKVTRLPEKETETGYKKLKDREAVFFRKGYHLDEPSVRGGHLDPAKDLHSRFEQYFAEATKAGNVILQAIIKGLGGLPEMARGILPGSHEHGQLSTNVSRAFHYFDTPLHTVICPPHHDLGLVTLIPSNFPGLQVYSLCGSCGLGWESTHKSLDSTDIVILAGESLHEFTGGMIPPGLHRVVSEKPAPINFPNFPFTSSLSPALTLPPSLSPSLSPSPSPTSPPPAANPPAKKSRVSKKAAAAAAAAAANNSPSTPPMSSLSSSSPLLQTAPSVQHDEPNRVGRISLPFLLRPRGDAKLDGTLVGLRQGRYPEKTAAQFFEEERLKKGGVAVVGQY